MYCTYIFDIMNKQEDYAKCLQIIEYIRNKEQNCSVDTDFLQRVNYITGKQEIVFSDITKYKKAESYDALYFVQKNDEVQYVFQIDCSNENDMVNLIYYCLVHDELGDAAILCVKAENNPKLAANVKDLLSDLMISGMLKESYILQNGSYRRLYSNKGRNIKRFSPIYRIDEKEESVAYWRQSVHTFLLKLYRKIPIAGGGWHYTINYFLPHICPGTLSGKKVEYGWDKQHKDPEIRLIYIMVECFCTSIGRNRKEYAEERYRIWQSEEFYQLVKDMPILAMYIFCISTYFLGNKQDNSIETLREEIFNARDMADGVLQIIENIYHSENKRGFFCFRVHNDSESRSRNYLELHYPKYMRERRAKEEAVEDYLEVKVVDFSHQTIPEQFLANFVKRMQNANAQDKHIYSEIQEQASRINVKSFFEALPFWQKYNSISENVVHHYGLQVFDSFVSCYDGYFRVRSQKEYCLAERDNSYSTTEEAAEESLEFGLPGTQYDIIIPFKKRKILQNISLNVNINYINHLINEYETYETIDFTTKSCMEVYNEIQKNNRALSYQEKKEKTIHELNVKLSNDLSEIKENTIIYFSAKNIALTMIEMFCKAIMLYIAKSFGIRPCYIMITDCTQSHFIEITRMLALFYDKQGKNSLMSGTQIFMSGEHPGEEFLISGCNLGEVVGSTEKLAFSRCINPDCLKILKNMLKNRRSGSMPNEVVSIVPFDMVEYDKNRPTLFEESLRYVLETEVQSDKFGCRIENLHVRIGSKIHIRTFYEAELLMHNNYYTSRFAYWLFSQFRSNQNIDTQKPITLVGYENYSEMLLNELCGILKKVDIDVDYMIYEQKAIEKFRAGKALYEYKDSQFILIVPINSTMTTHIKVAGFLNKSIRKDLKKHEIENAADYKLRKIIYYGIILISPINNKEYWEKKYWKRSEEKNAIISNIDHKEMKYYIEVHAEWLTPLQCKNCFPEEDYTQEVPLIETNKESVVPMHAIGIRRKSKPVVKGDISKEEKGRLKGLSNFLVYRHLERNGNHFNFYFRTEKLWDYPDVREKIRKWLEQKRQLFPMGECKTYDIIVAPLHYSNTAFVEEVNHYLFKNIALVLHFDIDKEFRMNVNAKYSSIQQLYENLCEGDEESVINFHYVDDTIISGRTYHRTKSLIRTLITTKEGAKVTINLFKSIVLLLNRLSPSSIKEYIEDNEYFLTYFNLNISSMRVNEDACVLCKKYEQWNKLAEQASLNEVYLYWKKKSEQIKCKSVEELYKTPDNTSDEESKQMRAGMYMIASHRAKSLLDQICDCCSIEEIENKIVEVLFPSKIKGSMDEMIAMLKVLGRPFLTFRRETKEAVFRLMLRMLNQLLDSSEPENGSKLQDILWTVWHEPELKTQLIVILINRLAELESNYIIRKKSMKRILAYAANICLKETEETKKAFISNYLNRIKQLVGQSNDFTKGLFLEYLLLYGKEYKERSKTKKMVRLDGDNEETVFKRKVYLENTKLIDYGIEALAWNFENGKIVSREQLVAELKNNYYLDNFVQYLEFHRMIKIVGKKKNIEFVTEAEARKLEGMVQFQILYRGEFGEAGEALEKEEKNLDMVLKDKFQKMLEYLKMASGALDAEIVVPYMNSIETVKRYIALGFGEGVDVRSLNNTEEELSEFMEHNAIFEGNTYTICKQGNRQWIIIKFYDAAQTGSNIPIIFLLFPFDIQNEGTLLHSLKNILVFREKIWRLLNLSSSTMLQNWTDNLYYKQQMLKNKATAHAEFEPLLNDLDNITEEIKLGKDNLLPAKYFDLLVNSLIGYMNAQVLGGKGKDFAEHACTLGEFWNGERKLYCAMCRTWHLHVVIRDGKNLARRNIREGTEGISKIPALCILRIFFLAVFQNVKKHGVQDSKGNIVVNVYEEEAQLCISNEIDTSKTEEVCKSITPVAYRRNEGISQAVIFDMCRGWYSDTQYEKVFSMEKDENSKRQNYVVKLPILERKGEE